MGFERSVSKYRCGCFTEEISHDSFNYTERNEYTNVCGRHPDEESAKKEQNRYTKMVEVIENARDELIQKMDTDHVIYHLAAREVVTNSQKEEIVKCKSKLFKARKAIDMMIESKKMSLHHIRMALIKAGQSNLLTYISEINPKENSNNDDNKSDVKQSADEKCMIELQGDSFVVAKEYNGQTYINIRNYQTIDGKKYPTKQGVSLTLSRWLVLESQMDFIDSVFQLCLAGEEVEEELIHLGGGVYVTLNSKFPTVDFRHFWQPENADKPVATRRGIPLNNVKWQKLSDVMKVMRDFVPELNDSIICRFSHDNQSEMYNCSECEPFYHNEEDVFISQNQEGDLGIMKHVMVPDSTFE